MKSNPLRSKADFIKFLLMNPLEDGATFSVHYHRLLMPQEVRKKETWKILLSHAKNHPEAYTIEQDGIYLWSVKVARYPTGKLGAYISEYIDFILLVTGVDPDRFSTGEALTEHILSKKF